MPKTLFHWQAGHAARCGEDYWYLQVVDHFSDKSRLMALGVIHDHNMVFSPSGSLLIQNLHEIKKPACEGDFIVVACRVSLFEDPVSPKVP